MAVLRGRSGEGEHGQSGKGAGQRQGLEGFHGAPAGRVPMGVPSARAASFRRM